MDDMNYYQILKIEKDATAEEINTAFKKLEKKYRSDFAPKSPALRAKKNAEFLKILEAFEVLSDSARRQEYDKKHGIKKKEKSQVQPFDFSSTDNFPKDWYASALNKNSSDENKNDHEDIDWGNDADLETPSPFTPAVEFERTPNTSAPAVEIIDTHKSVSKDFNLWKILGLSVIKPSVILLTCAIILLAVFKIPFIGDKYVLYSTALTDISYSVDKDFRHTLSKGTPIEIYADNKGQTWVETEIGNVSRRKLSKPQEGYMPRSHKYLTIFLSILIGLIALHLIFFRCCAAIYAYIVARLYMQHSSHKISNQDISKCIILRIKLLSHILLSIIFVVVSFYLVHLLFLPKEANVSSNDFVMNKISIKEIWLIFCSFVGGTERVITFMLCYLGCHLLSFPLLFSGFKCPRCGAPFSLFELRRYNTDERIFKKPIITKEYINGKYRFNHTMGTFKEYTLHQIFQCKNCKKERHRTSRKSEQI